MEIRRRIAIITAFIFCLSFFPPAEAYEIHGRISVAPPFPPPQKIKVKKKRADSCAEEQISQSLVVSSGGFLKNAVVSLKTDSKELLAGVLPSEPPAMDQKDCNFDPHILIVPENEKFRVLNSDPMTHDVRIFDGAQMLERFEMEVKAEPVLRTLKNPGTYLLRCGLHSWMHAYIVYAPHRGYSVSNENGEFVLRDIPAGDYVLHLWHETLGEADIPVKVEKNIDDFSYTFKNAGA